jgi:hypothetical protein
MYIRFNLNVNMTLLKCIYDFNKSNERSTFKLPFSCQKGGLSLLDKVKRHSCVRILIP